MEQRALQFVATRPQFPGTRCPSPRPEARRQVRLQHGIEVASDPTWPPGPPGHPDIDYAEMMRQFDTFLIGRKTFEAMRLMEAT